MVPKEQCHVGSLRMIPAVLLALASILGSCSLTVEEKVWDHKVYYPGAKHLHIQICGDQQTGKLLGAQIAGPIDTEVSKRVDIFATAIFHDMLVDDLNDLDLSYTPPLSAPWDAVQAVAQTWNRTARRSAGKNKRLAAS